MKAANRTGILAGTSALVLAGIALAPTSAFAAPSAGFGFNGPTGVAVQGQHVWVTNVNGNSVSELNARDGSLVRIISSDGNNQISAPAGIAANSSDVWVADLQSSSVTELDASTGSLVRTLSSAGLNGTVAVAVGGATVWVANQTHRQDLLGATIPFSTSVTRFSATTGAFVGQIDGSDVNGFNGTDAVAVGGAHAWVSNANSNTVTELDASTGKLIRVIRGDGVNGPQSVVASGSHVWIANQNGNSVTELSASDGALVRVISGGAYAFDGPSYLAVNAAHVWVTNPFADSVTEFNARDGSLVRVISATAGRLKSPMGIAVSGAHVWVANQWGNSLSELDSATGALVRLLH